jgi:4-amino-4-deoxy-L-arabinose transferase-like glycosyltransferase
MRRVVMVVSVIALLVRVAAAIATRGLWQPELFEYDAIARNMLNGQGFTYSHFDVVYHSYAPPMHSWITAASYLATGSIVPLMLMQAAAGAALVVVTALLAERLFGGWLPAAAAGLLVALHPGLVVYSATKAHPLTFDALFFALALLQTFRLADQPTTRRAAVLGLVIGIGALSRSTIVVFLPIAGLWLLFGARRPSWPTAVRLGVIAGVCAAAVMAPWTIRNALIHDRFVLVTTDSEVFWRGNNPYATGHSYVDADRIVLDLLPKEQLEEIRNQPDELAQAAWFAQQARTFIRGNPGAFVRLTVTKFFHFWWFAPQSGVLYPQRWLHLYMAYYLAVLFLAVAGVWTLAHMSPAPLEQTVVLVAFLVVLSGLQSLYYVEGRHRWAVEPMLLVLSGGGVAALIRRLGVDGSRFDAAASAIP